MALTWEFYVAVILVIIAILIVIAFVYLLFNPGVDVFDRFKSLFSRKKNSKDNLVQRPGMINNQRYVGSN